MYERSSISDVIRPTISTHGDTHQTAEKSMTTSFVLDVSKSALNSSMVVMCFRVMLYVYVFVTASVACKKIDLLGSLDVL
jgi:hypothetical protein